MNKVSVLVAGFVACLWLAASFSEAHVGASRPLGTIAYSHGNVCLVNADGSRRRCLTRSWIDYAPVVWSADGRRLAFERVHDDPGPGDRYEVLIMGADGRGTVKLTPPEAQDSQPAWSPVAPRIAFTRWTPSRSFGIYVAGADGSGVRELVPNAADPSWSPDGRKLAFTVERPRGIYVVSADGTRKRLVRRQVSGPVDWSPNGRMLMFVAQTPGLKTHVFLMNANGSGLRRLTKRCNEDYHPSWSPDGRTIAFTCWRANQDIFTASVEGASLRRLTTNPATDMYPAWSPDGRWLAYVAYRGENNGVWVMRSDGTEQRRITPYTHDSVPTWAPRQK